jgi:hypothetical protein
MKMSKQYLLLLSAVFLSVSAFSQECGSRPTGGAVCHDRHGVIRGDGGTAELVAVPVGREAVAVYSVTADGGRKYVSSYRKGSDDPQGWQPSPLNSSATVLVDAINAQKEAAAQAEAAKNPGLPR